MKNSIKKYSKKVGDNENDLIIYEKENESENEKVFNQENIILLEKENDLKDDSEDRESKIIEDYNNIDNLIKKIKDKENILNDKENEINNLKKEIEEKENKMKKIIITNNKLKQSLNEFSNQVDNKLLNIQENYENKQKYKWNLKNIAHNDELSKKELNNAMNIIKILQKDNQRLQSSIDNYEKINKLKDLENINKIKSDENSDLEKQIKILKQQLTNYNLYIKKCKIYETQISILNKENKSLKDNIKLLNNKLNKNKDNENEKEMNKFQGYSSPRKNIFSIKNDNAPNSERYNNNYPLKLNKKTIEYNISSLPKINIKNKTPIKSNSEIKLKILKKNYDNNGVEEILNSFFTEQEIEIIKKIFKNNANNLELFKKKLYIIHKSKESLNNKYNLEIKKYNQRIISAQEQIQYLNDKIRENEVNYRVLQTQLNEFNIEKKLFQKKIKNLQEQLAQKDNILKINYIDYVINNKKVKNNKNINKSKCIKTDINGISNIINDDSKSNNFGFNKDEISQDDNNINDSNFIKDDE